MVKSNLNPTSPSSILRYVLTVFKRHSLAVCQASSWTWGNWPRQRAPQFSKRCLWEVSGVLNVFFRTQSLAYLMTLYPAILRKAFLSNRSLGSEFRAAIRFDHARNDRARPLSLSIHLPIYLLSIYLSLSLSIYLSLSFYLSIDLSIYLSIDLSIYLYVCLSIYLSVYLSIYLSLSIYISPSFSLSISPPFCPSLSLPSFLEL